MDAATAKEAPQTSTDALEKAKSIASLAVTRLISKEVELSIRAEKGEDGKVFIAIRTLQSKLLSRFEVFRPQSPTSLEDWNTLSKVLAYAAYAAQYGHQYLALSDVLRLTPPKFWQFGS